MNFLGRMLDRLSWPVLLTAGLALLALTTWPLLSPLLKAKDAATQVHDLARNDQSADSKAPAAAAPTAPAAVETAKAVAPEAARPDAAKAVAAKPSRDAGAGTPPVVIVTPPMVTVNPPVVMSEMPPMPQGIPKDLEARIRKRVHDELARVQSQLEEQQKQAMQDREQARHDAEQAVADAQREYIDRRREAEESLRNASTAYDNRMRELKAQMAEAMNAPRTGKSAPKQGCVFQGGALRCQFNSQKDKDRAKGKDEDGDKDSDAESEADARNRKREIAGRVHEIEQAQREAKREFDNARKEAELELKDAKRNTDRQLEEARKEVARQNALLAQNQPMPVPHIKIPDIKIPELRIQPPPAPEVKAPDLPPVAKVAVPAPLGVKAAPAVPATPAAPSAKAAPAAPAAPLSQDAMAMVERDVGSAVADTIGQEVHSAVKGYREAVYAMTVGILLLLLAGAMVGKMVMASNRATRTRSELLRVEAERNLMSKQVVEAQLKMMQAQIEPHFLFNTLANVRFLMEADANSASTMLDHLIEYLHAALPQMRENSATLGRETELARAYLEILRIRMGNRLDFAIDVPENLQGVSLPPMMLLSLVENAIKHGLEPMREGGRLDIEASVDKLGNRLRVAVRDTGAGLAETAAAQSGTGVGLTNIRERLKTLYGESAHLELAENHPRGAVATIEIPYVEAPHGSTG
jgi:hypothetical protein